MLVRCTCLSTVTEGKQTVLQADPDCEYIIHRLEGTVFAVPTERT